MSFARGCKVLWVGPKENIQVGCLKLEGGPINVINSFVLFILNFLNAGNAFKISRILQVTPFYWFWDGYVVFSLWSRGVVYEVQRLQCLLASRNSIGIKNPHGFDFWVSQKGWLEGRTHLWPHCALHELLCVLFPLICKHSRMQIHQRKTIHIKQKFWAKNNLL